MDDLFRALSAGTKFRKAGLQQTTVGGPAGTGGKKGVPLAPAACDPSLDFFRTSVPASAHANKRHREISAPQDQSAAKAKKSGPQQGQGEDDGPKQKKTKKGKKGKGHAGDHAGAQEENGGVQVFAGRKKAREEEVVDHDYDDDDDGSDDAGGHVSQAVEDEVRAFRRKMHIHTYGDDVPPCVATFADMDAEEHIKHVLLRNIEESTWLEPTPIQMQAIPILTRGRDILASAPTGSGKTAAFVLPALCRLKAPKKHHGVRALFLAPTRELASQIFREVERLSRGKAFRTCLLSKAVAATGKASGDKGALGSFDIMVATPMRLVSVVREGALDLTTVEVVVMDEADKLFELGRESGGGDEAADKSFLGQIDEILAACSHPKVQRALFSATLPPAVEDLAATVLRDPVKVVIGTPNAGATTIDQRLVFVGREEGKLLAMRQLIGEGLRPPVLVFLQSKERAKELFHELVYDGINVDVIHAERTQEQRDAVIRQFRAGEIWVLICTDLMARGIDFKGVNMVINYDLPQSAVSYIHRIGRTGRAGRRGLAVTFFTEADMEGLRSIANVVKLSGCEVPEWMLSIKKLKPKERRKREMGAPHRHRISTRTGYDLKKANRKRQLVSKGSAGKKKAPASEGSG